MQARLPLEKVDKCQTLLSNFMTRKRVTLQIPYLTIPLTGATHFIFLSKQAKEDLEVWQTFITHFNGSVSLNKIWQSSNLLNLYTDAAGAICCGALFGNHWCYGRWPPDWLHLNIAILEFYQIILSLYL